VELRVGRLNFALHLDGIDEAAPGVRPSKAKQQRKPPA
jgi:hypothetical protein